MSNKLKNKSKMIILLEVLISIITSYIAVIVGYEVIYYSKLKTKTIITLVAILIIWDWLAKYVLVLILHKTLT